MREYGGELVGGTAIARDGAIDMGLPSASRSIFAFQCLRFLAGRFA